MQAKKARIRYGKNENKKVNTHMCMYVDNPT